MREYTLTYTDLLFIESLQARADRELESRMHAEVLNGNCKMPEHMPMCVANNREVQAIVEHLRELGPREATRQYGGPNFDTMAVTMMLARHTQPGINRMRVKANMQPSYTELERV